MTVKIGDTIPDISLKRLGDNGMEDISFAQYIVGKKVVLFAVPGAYTPTCAQKHLPGYVANADAMKAKGGNWSIAELNQFITKPKDFVPGTKMAFAGLKKDQDRANIIAYLQQQAVKK